MEKDSEKRFQTIMDKLFHAPKSSSSPGDQLSRGTKRPNTSSALALMDPKRRGDMVERSQQHSSASAGTPKAPLCRPWDRGDLMRRLATFKSMTWFAKPKLVSAVNCARRGWVNVDIDIIACEACGARLLFSTPSSWTQQQVEKTALVFSLKLENGHKLLCPWIDNACDEALARFPPMTPPVVVDKFRERCSALLELSALPVISSSAIECMRSSQLEQFLEQPSMLEYGNGSANNTRAECIDNELDADSANLYYQAQKLISLCGWEPRLVPYVVNSKNGANQPAKNGNPLPSSHSVTSRQNPTVNLESPRIKETLEADEYVNISSGVQSDPNSVVLDCKLCGANVGLWAFYTVPRPMELIRLIGYTEVGRENDSGTHESGSINHIDERGGVMSTTSNTGTSSKERATSLNLTIAGGPPPTRQNFKATISLPVIGQNLRARFSFDSEFKDRIYANQEDVLSDFLDKNLFQERSDHIENTPVVDIVQQDSGPINSEKHDHGLGRSTGNHSPLLSDNVSEKGDALTKENGDKLLEGTSLSGQGASPEVDTCDCNEENLNGSTQNVLRSSSQNGNGPENLNVTLETSAAEGPSSSQIRDPLVVASDAKVTIRNEESRTDDPPVMVESGNSSMQKMSATDVDCSKGKNLKRAWSDKSMEFDPIRQHRHFCPWITSTDDAAPGWQQTLFAFLRQKGFFPSPRNSPSGSIIKVDDPVTSVRRLFMSPSAKRMKKNSSTKPKC